MCFIAFVKATKFNVLISPTLCEQYIIKLDCPLCLLDVFNLIGLTSYIFDHDILPALGMYDNSICRQAHHSCKIYTL